jgi:hypothetical protein
MRACGSVTLSLHLPNRSLPRGLMGEVERISDVAANQRKQIPIARRRNGANRNGFLTVSAPVQAHPMLPLAPACNQYVFNGDFTLRRDNGALISFSSTGPVASGTVRGGTDSGTVTGSIQGRNVDFTINLGAQTLQTFNPNISALWVTTPSYTTVGSGAPLSHGTPQVRSGAKILYCQSPRHWSQINAWFPPPLRSPRARPFAPAATPTP